MKKIIKYKANDGQIFDHEWLCVKYEEELKELEEILQPLGKKPDNTDFTNGDGYLQHDIATLVSVRNKFNKFSINVIGDFYGRRICDSDHRGLIRAWNRLECMDVNQREWGQTYYAINPNAGKQVKLN